MIFVLFNSCRQSLASYLGNMGKSYCENSFLPLFLSHSLLFPEGTNVFSCEFFKNGFMHIHKQIHRHAHSHSPFKNTDRKRSVNSICFAFHEIYLVMFPYQYRKHGINRASSVVLMVMYYSILWIYDSFGFFLNQWPKIKTLGYFCFFAILLQIILQWHFTCENLWMELTSLKELQDQSVCIYSFQSYCRISSLIEVVPNYTPITN